MVPYCVMVRESHSVCGECVNSVGYQRRGLDVEKSAIKVMAAFRLPIVRCFVLCHPYLDVWYEFR